MASHGTMPTRAKTESEDDAIGGSEDVSETTKLFQERLQAWKHACGYLEEYVTATEKMHTSQSKDFDKSILKTVSSPLKEGEQFSQAPGGIGEMFENIRMKTQALSNNYAESAKTLKSTVLPIFERLHNDIKSKNKELSKSAGKSGKNLDKARASTQKHIELLGHHSAAAEHGGSSNKMESQHDPYVIQRGVNHRLAKQLQEEKNSRADTLQMQEQFGSFEAHIVKTLQQGISSLFQVIGGSLDQQKLLYSNMSEKANLVNPSFEWNGFVQRNSNILIDPNAPERTLSNISFPNQNHRTTQPLCQGALERKSGVLRNFTSAFYVITPSKYLHEYKSDDDIAKDPTPDTSLYLPDCTVGGLNGNLFSVKGKDVSGNKLGAAMQTSREYEFRANNSKDAETWWSIIRGSAGRSGSDISGGITPTESRNVSGTFGKSTGSQSSHNTNPQIQTSGITAGPEHQVQSPSSTSTTAAAAAGGVSGTPGLAK